MPLIDTTHLLQVADRAAYQYQQFKETAEAISEQGNDFYWEIISDTQDVDVEVPCEPPYEEVDDDWDPAWMVKGGTKLVLIIGGMEAHFNRKDSSGDVLQEGGWDGYCQDQDVRVSQYFAEMYYAFKGAYMLAIDVFSEGDDIFGTGDRIAGPAITFTDGVDYGDGSDLNPANGTYFAATQLKVKAETAIGVVDLDLRLSVKDINDNPTTIDVTVPAGTTIGTEIDVGTSSDRFLDVTNIGFTPGGDEGSLGEQITVRNKKERQIAL
jgi:hypothetical protein